MKLFRDIVAVIVAVAVSGLLLGVSGWLLVRSENFQTVLRMDRQYKAGQKPTAEEVEALFTAMDRQTKRIEWILSPLIVFIAGLTASLIGSRASVLLGILGSAPYAVFATSTSVQVEYGLLVLYLGIGALGAIAPILARKAMASSHGVQKRPANAGTSDASP